MFAPTYRPYLVAQTAVEAHQQARMTTSPEAVSAFSSEPSPSFHQPVDPRHLVYVPMVLLPVIGVMAIVEFGDLNGVGASKVTAAVVALEVLAAALLLIIHTKQTLEVVTGKETQTRTTTLRSILAFVQSLSALYARWSQTHLAQTTCPCVICEVAEKPIGQPTAVGAKTTNSAPADSASSSDISVSASSVSFSVDRPTDARHILTVVMALLPLAGAMAIVEFQLGVWRIAVAILALEAVAAGFLVALNTQHTLEAIVGKHYNEDEVDSLASPTFTSVFIEPLTALYARWTRTHVDDAACECVNCEAMVERAAAEAQLVTARRAEEAVRFRASKYDPLPSSKYSPLPSPYAALPSAAYTTDGELSDNDDRDNTEYELDLSDIEESPRGSAHSFRQRSRSRTRPAEWDSDFSDAE